MRRSLSPALALFAAAALVSACGDGTPSASGADVISIDDASSDVPLDTAGADDASADPSDDTAPSDADEPDAGEDATAPDAGEDVAEPDASFEGCTSDQCDIGGDCFDNGTANPDNPCEVCLVIQADDAWSFDDAAACDDGDACTADDACFEGTCMGTISACEDGNACTAGLCDPLSGECSFEDVEGSCDDGDPCTTEDSCSEGTCVGAGALACDDGDPCTVERCEPGVGCVSEPADGVACDDGDPCTVGDTCTAGVCSPGADPLDCGDENLCTIDRCIPGVGCDYVSIADSCSDDNPCTDETCDPTQGCVYPFNTDPCEDGDVCTMGDTCTEGVCLGMAVSVDDLNLCTDDICTNPGGVANIPNTDPCDDFNACTVGDTCADGGCVPGTDPLVCDDLNVCTDDACDADTGCTFTNNTVGCDDGNACTISDTCGGGVCSGTVRNCDDGNACTADSCDAETGCENTLIATNDCRPNIVVDFPPRAATILGGAFPGSITVTGSVSSGAGDITSLVLNDEEVTLTSSGAGTFAFAVPVDTLIGSNTLRFEATDSFGTTRERIQGFHWSTSFTSFRASSASDQRIEPGLGLWLGQETIDDGAPPPPTDFASIFSSVLDSFDLGGIFDSDTPATSVGALGVNFDIYVRTLNYDNSAIALAAIDGGLRLALAINGINGRLFIDCTSSGIACFFAGGDNGGSLSASSIGYAADIQLRADGSGGLDITIANASTSVSNTDISSDGGFQNFLLGVAASLFFDIEATLESELNGVLADTIEPLLSDALSGLALNLPFDLPSLNPAGGDTIPVSLATDFNVVEFQDGSPGPQGGLLGLGASAETTVRGVDEGEPFDSNLGSPDRNGCGVAVQELVVPGLAPLEVIFPDDTLNGILYAAWWGGLLEFPLDPSILGDLDLESLGITDLTLDVSAWLPPVASDCRDGRLLLSVADLRVDASLQLFGQPLDLVVYTAFDAPIELLAADGQLGVVVDDIENVELEVNVIQEDLVASEAVIGGLLETELVPALGDLLGGGEPLASFPLPAFDLSEGVGLPPGSLEISIGIIDALGDTRQGGNTIVYGELQ